MKRLNSRQPIAIGLFVSNLGSIFMQSFEVENVEFGGGELSFLLGPVRGRIAQTTRCLWRRRSRRSAVSVGVGFVYKSSFDKANRSSIESFRGRGNGVRT